MTLLALGLWVTPAWSETPNTITNSIGMSLVLIPAGSFLMGTDHYFQEALQEDETPRHSVTISKPFYLGQYEVTQAQWVGVMRSNPSRVRGPDQPVDQVGWSDAVEFVRELNHREGTSAYRLPTEAEWEYACRAGVEDAILATDSDDRLEKYRWYDIVEDKDQPGKNRWYDSVVGRDNKARYYAWHNGNTDGRPQPVGKLQRNAWGLNDMQGNVWEWVEDVYDRGFYRKSEAIEVDPVNKKYLNYNYESYRAEGGDSRIKANDFKARDLASHVLRGGSANYPRWWSRCAARGRTEPNSTAINYGFRVARTID